MRALVAGGAGMIGSHLVDHLLERGDTVVALDNLLTGRAQNLAHLQDEPRFALRVADVAAPQSSLALDGRFDRIYHLASPASPADYERHPLETLAANSTGTRNLLELALRNDARFLLASTSEIYGDPAEHPQSESYWGNVNPLGLRACYNEAKRFAESLTATFGRTFGVDVRIARIFNVYGPRSRLDDGRVIPEFLVRVLRGEPLPIYGTGSQTRSLCYVSDSVRGLHALMEGDGLAGQAVNVGNDEEHSVIDIAGIVSRLVRPERPADVVYLPLPSDEPARRRPDLTKAHRLLGWSPQVPLAQGLMPTLDYVRSELQRSPLPDIRLSRQAAPDAR